MTANRAIDSPVSGSHGWDLSAAITLIRSQTANLTTVSLKQEKALPSKADQYKQLEGPAHLDNHSEPSLGDFDDLFSVLRLDHRNSKANRASNTNRTQKQSPPSAPVKTGSQKTWKRARRRAAQKAREQAENNYHTEHSETKETGINGSLDQASSPSTKLTNVEKHVGGSVNGVESRGAKSDGESHHINRPFLNVSKPISTVTPGKWTYHLTEGEFFEVLSLGKAQQNLTESHDAGQPVFKAPTPISHFSPGKRSYSHTDSEVYESLSLRKAQQNLTDESGINDVGPELPENDGANKVGHRRRKSSRDVRRDIIQDVLGTPEEKRKKHREGKLSHGNSTRIRRGSASDFENSSRSNASAIKANSQKRNELVKLIFGNSKTGVKQPAFVPASVSLGRGDTADQKIHVFVDISNILIGFHDTLKVRRGISKTIFIPRQCLSFSQFSLILERNRPAAKRVLVGSAELECTSEAKGLGYECNILKRVVKDDKPSPRKGHHSYKHQPSRDSASESEPQRTRSYEQGVDEILHLKMLESLLDADEPATMVLATGDAAAAEYSDGFLRMAERALDRGWSVEVVAFSQGMSSAYTKGAWKNQWDGRFKVVLLDDFVELLRLEL